MHADRVGGLDVFNDSKTQSTCIYCRCRRNLTDLSGFLHFFTSYIHENTHKESLHISATAMAHPADPGCECIPFRNAEAWIAAQ